MSTRVHCFTYACEADRDLLEALLLSARRLRDVRVATWSACFDPGEVISSQMLAVCRSLGASMRRRPGGFAPWDAWHGIAKWLGFVEAAEGVPEGDYVAHVDSDCIFTSAAVLDFLGEDDAVGIGEEGASASLRGEVRRWWSGAFMAIRAGVVRRIAVEYPMPRLVEVLADLRTSGLTPNDDVYVSRLLERCGARVRDARPLADAGSLEAALRGGPVPSLLHYCSSDREFMGRPAFRGKRDFVRIAREEGAQAPWFTRSDECFASHLVADSAVPEAHPTIVAIGSSTARDYSFLAPLTALFWRDVVGHRPITYLIGTRDEWEDSPRTALALRGFRDHDLDVRHVPRIAGYEDSTLAQNVRQHAAAERDVDDDTWIMMSDADLWPLRREYYYHHVGWPARAVCYYSNGDHFFGKKDVLDRAGIGISFQTLPTCHVAMRAREWRALYPIAAGSVRESTRRTLDGWLRPRMERARAVGDDAGWEAWMSDQRCCTERLCQQSWFPCEVLFLERYGSTPSGTPPDDRLDRDRPEQWVLPHDRTRWVDAHVPKAPEEDLGWSRIAPVIAAHLPQHADWAERYRAEFHAAPGAP